MTPDVFSDALIQPAAYVGVWGLSLLSVVALAMPAILGLPGPARQGWIVTVAALLLPGLAWLGGLENTHLCGQVIYVDGGSDAVIRGDSVW